MRWLGAVFKRYLPEKPAAARLMMPLLLARLQAGSLAGLLAGLLALALPWGVSTTAGSRSAVAAWKQAVAAWQQCGAARAAVSELFAER